MAERKENKKAEAAMEVSNKFKEIESLLVLARTKAWEADMMVKRDGGDSSSVDGVILSIGVTSHEAVRQQSIWHNIAFGRGYFETVEGPRKMSKTEIDR